MPLQDFTELLLTKASFCAILFKNTREKTERLLMIGKKSEVTHEKHQTAQGNFNNLRVENCFDYYIVLNFDVCPTY